MRINHRCNIPVLGMISIFSIFDSTTITCKANLFKIESDKISGDYLVEWSLFLGGQEFLLRSPFLKAGFEQNVKDYINDDLVCSNELETQDTSFHSVEFASTKDFREGTRRLRISGNGRCKGKKNRCKRTVKKSTSDAGRKLELAQEIPDNESKFSILLQKDFCDSFRQTTVFDAFKDTILTATSFNYNVSVELLDDLQEDLELNYTVTFVPNQTEGLDQIEEIELEADEPVEVKIECTGGQCDTQQNIIQTMFTYFGIPFDENNGVCSYRGINCNTDNLVTQIWLGGYNLTGKSIPKSLGRLTSLNTIFLGGCGLIGTIPFSLSKLNNLELLWLNDNELSGQIPSKLGNLKGLLELNFSGNKLTGTIPSEFRNLGQLSVLNLGRNALKGKVPDFGQVCHNKNCNFNKKNSKIKKSKIKKSKKKNHKKSNKSKRSLVFSMPKNTADRETSTNEENVFVNLEILALYDNQLSGSIPNSLFELVNLKELNIAGNNLSGTLPRKISSLSNLNVLDLHDNSFTGTIPFTLGRLMHLMKLNLYNNSFAQTIPITFGKLTQLTELILDNNALTGPIPSRLGKLEKLEYLTFSDNRMSGEIPSELGNLKLLKNLDIRDYLVKQNQQKAGTLPSELGKLSLWKYVVFRGNDLQGTLPPEFGGLANSEFLWLQGNSLTGPIPLELANIESLSVLSLSDNDFTGTIPIEFGEIEGLEAFDIGDNLLSGTIPTELGQLDSLEFLDFGNNKLNGSIPSELGDIASLQVLDLGGNDLTGTIPTELENLEDLDVIDISGNDVSGDPWFVCDLKSYALGDSIDLDCSNYCGTVDEECNAETLYYEADCLDIGCGGPGVPTCTEKCRLDYSSCSAGEDELSFTLKLETDEKGWETTWNITSLSESESIFSGGPYRNSATIVEHGCIKRGCYLFQLFDSSGDGICCGENNLQVSGNYELLENDIPVKNVNPDFGQSIAHEIGVCTVSPFPSPETVRSSSPSSVPTLDMVTSPPSKTKSQSPSSNPTNQPTSSPVTNAPTIRPSSSPTFAPTSNPTSIPTFLPSFDPSSISLSPSFSPDTVPPTTEPSVTLTDTLVPFESSNNPTQFIPSTPPSSQEPSSPVRFVLQISSGTCASRGYIPILDNKRCLEAAESQDYNITWGPFGGYDDVVDGCSIRFGTDLFMNGAGNCNPEINVGNWTYTGCECVEWMPCFCEAEIQNEEFFFS